MVVEGAGEVAPGLSASFYYAVTPGYFDALGVTMLQGRGFAVTDADVVVVNREMAERLRPGRSRPASSRC